MSIDVRPDEVWKLIEGYPHYMVSNHGRIINSYRNRLLQQSTTDGYSVVNLCADGKPTLLRVHRLVAVAFIDNPDSKEQVNHLDEVRSNNRADNLEWATPLENTVHSIKKVSELVDPMGVTHTTKHLKGFCREHGLDSSQLHRVRRGERTHHKGWRLL